MEKKKQDSYSIFFLISTSVRGKERMQSFVTKIKFFFFTQFLSFGKHFLSFCSPLPSLLQLNKENIGGKMKTILTLGLSIGLSFAISTKLCHGFKNSWFKLSRCDLLSARARQSPYKPQLTWAVEVSHQTHTPAWSRSPTCGLCGKTFPSSG